MKLTPAQRRTWRAAMEEWAEGAPMIRTRAVARRLGITSMSWTHGPLDAMRDGGIIARPGDARGYVPVPGVAVGSDGQVYRLLEIAP